MEDRKRGEIDVPNKVHIAALEKVFAAEIGGRLLFQSKAQIYRTLFENGYLDEDERTLGTGWSAVTVKGYTLTNLGRLTYCATCRDTATEPSS